MAERDNTARDRTGRTLRAAKRHYYLGSAAMLEGDLPFAEESFSAAVQADPLLSPAWSLFAQVLGQRGELERAEKAWLRLCALTPTDASN